MGKPKNSLVKFVDMDAFSCEHEAALLRSADAKVMSTSESVDIPESELTVNDGSKRCFTFKKVPMVGSSSGAGKSTLIMSVGTDITELRQTKQTLQSVQEEQRQFYEDLSHQLVGPINQAYARLSQILLETPANDELQYRHLAAVKGLLGKARRVTLSVGLLADLQKGNRLDPPLQRLTQSEIVRMLIQASQDNEMMVDPNRKIRFHVRRQTFTILSKIKVNVHPALLEQAVNNILDNAAKYSYNLNYAQIRRSHRRWSCGGSGSRVNSVI